MARGKTIQLYLMDSVPKGRIKCTLANWTGIAYKIPRTELEKANASKSIKGEVASIAVMAAGKIINKTIDADTNRNLIDEVINEIGDERWSS